MNTTSQKNTLVEKIKLTIPFSENTLEFFWTPTTLKNYLQSLLPYIKIRGIPWIYTPWWRDPWKNTHLTLFHPKYDNFRIEILTYALATKKITFIIHNTIGRNKQGILNKNHQTHLSEIDLTSGKNVVLKTRQTPSHNKTKKRKKRKKYKSKFTFKIPK